MNIVTGINKQSSLEVLYKKLDDERNRIEVKYRVTHSSIEPVSQLGIDERTFYIQNKAAVLDEQGEVTTPADNALDDFNDQILSRVTLDEAAKQKAIAHAQVALGFVEYIDPTIEAWENENPETPEPANTTPWEVNVFVATGMKRSYEGEVYLVKQSHTTQSDWTPDVTPALFKLMPQGGSGGLPIWSQPSGAADSYALGAQVKKGNKCYESAVDNNVWMPGGQGIGDNIWFEIDCP